MRLYDLLKQVSDILTPETHALYDYMLHTFDDNGGFLRTRYCYWDKPLKDYNVPDLSSVLVCFVNPFSEEALYSDTMFGKDTIVKMQLFYWHWTEDDVIWSRGIGYKNALVIDLNNKCVEEWRKTE